MRHPYDADDYDYDDETDSDYRNESDGGNGAWGVAGVCLVLGLFCMAAAMGLALGGWIDGWLGSS